MRDTQIAAYDDILPTLSEKRAKVYGIILERPSTLFELCDSLNWPVNRVSGRVTELSKNGLIVDSGSRRINPNSGKSGIVWETKKDKNNGMPFVLQG